MPRRPRVLFIPRLAIGEEGDIEDIPKQPTFGQITPGSPEQLFAAAYTDYSRGNNALARSEF
jgi:hypothetical protein